jgi:hypothetical protein
LAILPALKPVYPMRVPKYHHGLPCNCLTRMQLLGIIPVDSTNCPSICSAASEIIGVSDSYTVDGWYLQIDASNLVYMEADTIIETVPCESGLADFKITSGAVTIAPAVWHNDSWQPLIIVDLKTQNVGVDFSMTTQIGGWFTNECTGLAQISTDGGATWVDVGTMTNSELTGGLEVVFNTTETDYIVRVIVTDTVTGCSYYNPSPDTGIPAYGIYYALIDPSVDPLFTLLGSINGVTPLDDPFNDWVDILITMADPYQTVAGRLGGIGVDFSQQDGGGGFESPFYLQIISPIVSVPTELAVVLDSSGTPFDTSPQGVATVVKNYVATYTFADPDVTFFEGFVIFGANVRYNQLGITNPAIQQGVELFMIEYQLADPAFSFYVEVNPTNVQVFVTTAIPVESILVDETGVGYTIVPLIEI